MTNNVIYTTPYGSHLYGTNVATSDSDTVKIFVPDYRDLLLEKSNAFASKQAITSEGDVTMHAVGKIVRDIAKGNFTALELLFSTALQNGRSTHLLHKSWRKVYLNRHRLLTKSKESFLGYCLSQAKKYDRRGEKKIMLDALQRYFYEEVPIRAFNEKLENRKEIVDTVRAIGGKEIEFIDIPQEAGTIVTHIKLCGKLVPLTTQVSFLSDTVKRLLGEYGARTAEAATKNGVDWKGMMHAVRIAEEAIEFFKTGEITFPRNNAGFLIQIRNGEINYDEVSALIDKLLVDAEAAAVLSNLRDEADKSFMDALLLEIYEENKYG